ncbi:uncharacterized protein LMH87_007659 [Akanthomyces muscarius]|uniref:Uncharacterized protein n=1 Tax=Akanthomyces muscarius TaxID=2231603 RepID=A0A9W8QLB8_AKAMU|nr:uncharacterized protein LMH87_007659 [Akanthomyces muscarius]KAJ4161631.1 hypothetical protein LMH87_007659 [Akanthomyces muscarius]
MEYRVIVGQEDVVATGPDGETYKTAVLVQGQAHIKSRNGTTEYHVHFEQSSNKIQIKKVLTDSLMSSSDYLNLSLAGVEDGQGYADRGTFDVEGSAMPLRCSVDTRTFGCPLAIESGGEEIAVAKKCNMFGGSYDLQFLKAVSPEEPMSVQTKPDYGETPKEHYAIVREEAVLIALAFAWRDVLSHMK